jgi:hypothetical protein
MASAERRRLFERLAWHYDDNDAQLDRINIFNHEAKRAMRSPTASTLYTTRPRATGGRGIETQPPLPPHTQGERNKRARPRDRLIIAADFTSMPTRFAHRPRASFLCYFKKNLTQLP